jgi:hemoglobin-like flavoprotein
MTNIKPVINSYLHCLEKEGFLDRFYELFLATDERISDMFLLVDFDKQKELLRKGIMTILTFLDHESLAGKITIKRLRETHGSRGMNILPEYYELWKSCLIQTVEEYDHEFSEEIRSDWEDVLKAGIELMTTDHAL